jgi:hypothetical protein
VKYRLTYQYWNNFTKQYTKYPVYETEAANFAAALDKFYSVEIESDGDIKALHITSVQKKTWLGWKEI